MDPLTDRDQRRYSGSDWLVGSFFRTELALGKRKPLLPFALRAADLLGDWQRGIYHLPPSSLTKAKWDEDAVVIVIPGELATTDADMLTRLVLLARARCIRVAIEAATVRYLRITLSPRKWGATTIMEGHPSIEGATEKFRQEFGL